ncbi:MAG: UbiA family prenyltransferase [Pseudomonadota bacterium]
MQKLIPYIKIARIDHWFKNVFMLPGVLVAIYIDHIPINASLFFNIVLALLALGLVASSNYVINEILDAEKDKHHPVKKNRPVPSGQIHVPTGLILWVALALAGLVVAWSINGSVFWCSLALWVMGCLYNIPPVRSKEKPYLDVLSESVNNPLRLLIGWYATSTALLAPISLVIAYWMIGAFFMAAKRYAEYRKINDPVRAAAYRASFAHYNGERLLISIIYYIAAFGLFLGIFLIRYRIELIVGIPFIAGVVTWYLHLTFQPDSPVQYPEKLYKETSFVAFTLISVIICVLLLYIDIPLLGQYFAMTSAH